MVPFDTLSQHGELRHRLPHLGLHGCRTRLRGGGDRGELPPDGARTANRGDALRSQVFQGDARCARAHARGQPRAARYRHPDPLPARSLHGGAGLVLLGQPADTERRGEGLGEPRSATARGGEALLRALPEPAVVRHLPALQPPDPDAQAVQGRGDSAASGAPHAEGCRALRLYGDCHAPPRPGRQGLGVDRVASCHRPLCPRLQEGHPVLLRSREVQRRRHVSALQRARGRHRGIPAGAQGETQRLQPDQASVLVPHGQAEENGPRPLRGLPEATR